jgi:uncharacterized NAD-dependent epimerase/dehydratase family protein
MKSIDLTTKKLCVYLAGYMRSKNGKTGLAVLRYSGSEIAAVIDPEHAGENLSEVTGISRMAPIVSTVEEARRLGADTLLLGAAPSGGAITDDIRAAVAAAVSLGMSVVNGLHEELAPQFATVPGQVIMDVRKPTPDCMKVGFARALQLTNRRILTVGTDMSIGKMSASLELRRAAINRGLRAKFLATGQTGIMIEGFGIPLDAVPVDFAAGSVEYATLTVSTDDCDLLFVEGQGSLLNPASTATLPLIRGSQPTHLIMVHHAAQTHVRDNPAFPIPPLSEVIKLCEDVSRAGGVFPGAKVVGIALNTSTLTNEASLAFIEATRKSTGLPTTDAVRFGCEELLDAIMA